MAANLRPASEDSKSKLLDQVREVLRVEHYSLRTDGASVDWIKRFFRSKSAATPRCSRKGQSSHRVETAKGESGSFYQRKR
jgi:hypothetical protein